MKLGIEKGIKTRRSNSKYDFDSMDPGDSFYYEGNRNTAIIAFGYYLAKGIFETHKEGNGWRFVLKRKTKPRKPKIKE